MSTYEWGSVTQCSRHTPKFRPPAIKPRERCQNSPSLSRAGLPPATQSLISISVFLSCPLVLSPSLLVQIAPVHIVQYEKRKIFDDQTTNRFCTKIFVGNDFSMFDVLGENRPCPTDSTKIDTLVLLHSLADRKR